MKASQLWDPEGVSLLINPIYEADQKNDIRISYREVQQYCWKGIVSKCKVLLLFHYDAGNCSTWKHQLCLRKSFSAEMLISKLCLTGAL